MADSTDEGRDVRQRCATDVDFVLGSFTEVAVHAGINTRSYRDAAKAQKNSSGLHHECLRDVACSEQEEMQ
jgi:hypothetical protein